ncbi:MULTISPECIES: hypothetical protein [Olivibacter]|uniref:Uncharacterized protein n=1 Tax=Olivibacter jilunii TaxID=985016 RepID=A0ABW6B073_9SPHI
MNKKSYFERIQELKGKARLIQNRDEATISELESLYKAVFKDSIKKGCGDCAVAAYGKLIRLTEDQVNTMSTKKFVLKKNVAIQLEFGSAEMISNETLTDDLAIRLLSKRPKLISEFEKYPVGEDGKVLLELPTSEINAAEDDEPVADPNANSNDPEGKTDPLKTGEVPDDSEDGEPKEDSTVHKLEEPEAKDSDSGTDSGEPGSSEHEDQDKSREVNQASTGEQPVMETDSDGRAALVEQLSKAEEIYNALPKNQKLTKEGQEVKKQIDEFKKQLEG